MKSIILYTLLIFLAAIVQADACTKKNGHLDLVPLAQQRVSSSKLNKTINPVVKKYLKKMHRLYVRKAKDLGGNLRFIVRKTDLVNANVRFRKVRGEDHFEVSFYNGILRHKKATVEALVAVGCHEIGHILGSAPKYTWGRFSGEGQADYFATQTCLKNVFKMDNNRDYARRRNIDQIVRRKCEKTYGKNRRNSFLCMRVAMAGKQLALLLQSLRGEEDKKLSFVTKDTSKVASTITGYPSVQCRLDTFFAGALCYKNELPIMGEDTPKGNCMKREGLDEAARPACWYKEEA